LPFENIDGITKFVIPELRIGGTIEAPARV